jgi:hypothetical protein
MDGPKDNRETPKEMPVLETVAGTIRRNRDDGSLWFNISKETGRDAQHLPNELKSREYVGNEDVIERLDWILAQVGTWADPRLGGLWGGHAIAARFHRDPSFVKRNVSKVSSFDYIELVGAGSRNRLPVTCARSVDNHVPAADTKYVATLYPR